MKKIKTFLTVVFLFVLSFYQDIIGQFFLNIVGLSNVNYLAGLLLGKLVTLPFFLFLLESYKKIKVQEFISSLNLKRVLLFFVLPITALKVLPFLGLYLLFTIHLNKAVSLSLQESWPVFLLFAINTIVLGPIIEEILYRAVLFDQLKKFVPVVIAAILSSLAFALVHAEDSQLQLIVVFISGVILATIYQKTKNLAYSIAVHMCLNAMTVFFMLVSF